MAAVIQPEQFQLETVEDDKPERASIAPDVLLLALKALSQRALVAFSACFTLLTVASAFALWWRVMPDPTPFQLGGLGLYALFVLAVHMVRK